MTTDTPTTDTLLQRLLETKLARLCTRELRPYVQRTLWAIDSGIITPADVPEVEKTFDSVDRFVDWMRSSGVEAAYDAVARRLVDSCPPWCERDHQDRIGPDEETVHVSAPLGADVPRHPERFESVAAFQTLTIDQGETFEEGLKDRPEVWVEGFTVTEPDELERIADTLRAAAVRWRELTR